MLKSDENIVADRDTKAASWCGRPQSYDQCFPGYDVTQRRFETLQKHGHVDNGLHTRTFLSEEGGAH